MANIAQPLPGSSRAIHLKVHVSSVSELRLDEPIHLFQNPHANHTSDDELKGPRKHDLSTISTCLWHFCLRTGV